MIPRSQLRDTVQRFPYLGDSGMGDEWATQGAPVKVQAEHGLRRVAGTEGTETVAALTLLSLPMQEWVINDRVAYTGRTYRVVDIQPVGTHHNEVLLQSTGA
jgi:hypothetical protein